jgi:glycosyltransferase 2 family protein
MDLMTDQTKLAKPIKFTIWHYIPVVLILGLAGYFLFPQIASLTRSWYVVKSMTLWAVIAAAVTETISWIGNGVIFYYILKANGRKMSILRGSLIALGTLAVSLVAGGGVGLAVSYGWLYRESKDGNAAFLAGTMPAFFNTGTIMAASIIGVIYLFFVHDLTTGQLVQFGIALLLLGIVAAVTIAGMRSEMLVKKVADWGLSRWAKIRQQPYNAEQIFTDIDKFFVASKSMENGRWSLALLGAIINVGFDMLTMFFLFIAAGSQISAGTLFAGYGLPLVLAKVAFIFPGGIGVVESSMNSLFSGLGVPAAISVVVVMSYRLFSFWIPTILGFGAAAFLSGKHFRSQKVKNEENPAE